MNKTFSNKAGNLILELRKDTMSAWLTIKKSGHLIDEAEIVKLIEEAGIKTGFEEALSHIREHSLEKEFDTPFPIAICSGKPNQSVLKYNFNPDLSLDPTQPLSYEIFQRLISVPSGAVIAEYTNNIFEHEGSIYDIFGELISQGSIDEDQALAMVGSGVSFSLSDRQYLATTSGFPYVDAAGRICIATELILNSSDLPSEVSFDHHLSLKISGDLAQQKLHSAGTLFISGDIHNSEVDCHGDLHLEGDIINCNADLLIIRGDLFCKNISSSKVICQKTLRFGGSIRNSSVVCDGDILGSEGSNISGGNAQAGGSVSISEAGDNSGSLTEIEIAISPFHRTLLLHLSRKLIHLKSDPEANAHAIDELQALIKHCEEKLDENLTAFINRTQTGQKRVVISGEIHPPISIRVLKHNYHYSSSQSGLELVEKE